MLDAKNLTRLRGTNFRINGTSLGHFAPSFMQLRNGPQCTHTLRNATKHELSPMRWIGCAHCQKFDSTSWHELSVAEPPELSRLKCAGHHHKGNTDLNALQMEQFLVCRVMSRYNHRISDRTSIPRTKASPEILQPYILQHRHNSYYNKFKVLLQVQTQ